MFRWVCLCIVLFLSLCSCSDDDPHSERVSLSVESYLRPCYSMVQQLCMHGSDVDDKEAWFYYGEIAGFDYRWGSEYEIIVEVTQVDNPPMDAPSENYRLIDISSVIEDQIGTIYECLEVQLLEETFTIDNGEYYFLRKPFKCAPDVDCDALVGPYNSGEFVDIRFEYMGSGQIQLVHWDNPS